MEHSGNTYCRLFEEEVKEALVRYLKIWHRYAWWHINETELPGRFDFEAGLSISDVANAFVHGWRAHRLMMVLDENHKIMDCLS